MAKTKKQSGEGYADASAVVKKTTADGPRAPKPSRRPAPKEAQAGGPFGPNVSDASLNAVTDVGRAGFDAVRGEPSPRQRAGRVEDVGGTHTEPGQLLPSGVPVPID